MKYFFSYGDDNFKLSKQRIYNQAKKSGFFDVVNVYGPEDLSDEFKQKYASILKYKRGGGYWIWKFFFINKYLNEVQDNDFIIYADTGCTINKKGEKRFNEYIEMLSNSEYGFLSFSMDMFRENQWTIKELYEYFGVDINDSEVNKNQYSATVLVIKKCANALLIISEIMKLLEYDKYLITDKYNDNQSKFFIEARHDQSILSLARKKNGSISVADETFLKIAPLIIVPWLFFKKIVRRYIVFRSNSFKSKPSLSSKKSLSSSFSFVDKLVLAKNKLINFIFKYINFFFWKVLPRKEYPFWATRIRK